MRASRSKRRTAGFTLVEAIVALGIFAILVTVGIPTMTTWVRNNKVRAVADTLQNGLRLAQNESLRRSRQIVFSLTNSTAPATSLTATANGAFWSVNTIPAMTDGSEAAAFLMSGMLTTTSSGVTITGPAAICFNSVGRLIPVTTTGVTGATCTLPTNSPASQTYQVNYTGADHPLNVRVTLGGQVHMCDPSRTLSATNPDGC